MKRESDRKCVNHARVHASAQSFDRCEPVHTVPEKFENGDFTLKTHQMISVQTTLEEFKNATITGYFGIVFDEKLVKEIASLPQYHRFRKASMMFSVRPHKNEKPGFSNSSGLKSFFE